MCKFFIKMETRECANLKNSQPSWLYYTVVGLSEAATGGVLQKKLFLKISLYSQEKTCVGVWNSEKKREETVEKSGRKLWKQNKW